MFPRNKINIIFRILCLISYIIVILVVNSPKTLIILGVVYAFLALCERSFNHIVLIIFSLLLLWLCHTLDNYVLFKIILLIDFIYYYLEATYYEEEKEPIVINEKDYIRFKKANKNKKKGSNNIVAIYLTVHLGLLFLAIMVG